MVRLWEILLQFHNLKVRETGFWNVKQGLKEVSKHQASYLDIVGPKKSKTNECVDLECARTLLQRSPKANGLSLELEAQPMKM